MAHSLVALVLGLLPCGEPLRLDGDCELLPPGAIARFGSFRGREPTGRHHLAAYCPARNLLATAGYDNQVRLYEATTGRPLAGRQIADQAVYALAFSPDGRLLALAGSTRIVLLDLLTREQPFHLEGWPSTISGLVFSPDGRFLVGLESREGIRIWETSGGKVWNSWKTPGRRLYQAAFHTGRPNPGRPGFRSHRGGRGTGAVLGVCLGRGIPTRPGRFGGSFLCPVARRQTAGRLYHAGEPRDCDRRRVRIGLLEGNARRVSARLEAHRGNPPDCFARWSDSGGSRP